MYILFCSMATLKSVNSHFRLYVYPMFGTCLYDIPVIVLFYLIWKGFSKEVLKFK